MTSTESFDRLFGNDGERMKRKTDYTEQEKIDLFDELHDECLEEMNRRDIEGDKQYFYEGVMDTVLSLTDVDWKASNDGVDLG